MKEYIETNIGVENVDYISGGERRDWYFSNIMAYLLNKPHVTIYKDLTTVESNYNFENNTEVSSLENKSDIVACVSPKRSSKHTFVF